MTATTATSKNSTVKEYAFAEANVKLREWCDRYRGRTLLLSKEVFGSSIGHYKSGRNRITDENIEIMNLAMAQIEREEQAGLIKRVARGGTVRSELNKTAADFKRTAEYYQQVRDSDEFKAFSKFFEDHKHLSETLYKSFGILFLDKRFKPQPKEFTYVNKERVLCAERWINEYKADPEAISICAKRIKALAGDRTKLLSANSANVRKDSKLSADKDVNELMMQLENDDELFEVTADVYAVNFVEDSEDSFADFYKLLECKSKSYLTAILRRCINRARMVIHNNESIYMEGV